MSMSPPSLTAGSSSRPHGCSTFLSLSGSASAARHRSRSLTLSLSAIRKVRQIFSRHVRDATTAASLGQQAPGSYAVTAWIRSLRSQRRHGAGSSGRSPAPPLHRRPAGPRSRRGSTSSSRRRPAPARRSPRSCTGSTSSIPAPGTGLRLLYVSPLKALNYDVERNLRGPLAGIKSDLRVGVRTGDTTQKERRELVKEPPDILITTPESLFLMLTSQARETLRGIETVIVDEVHAVAGTKRGAHLALSLERLDALLERPGAADRPLGDPAPARGDRPLRLRRPSDPARRCGHTQGARPRGRRPGRGSARARHVARPRPAGRERRRRDGVGLRVHRPLDLALDLPRRPRARPAAPLDDRLRQQPAARRAPRRAAERARRGGNCARAPRLARARTAGADRGGLEGGPDPVPRRDLQPRARDRHGRRRPRDPGREPEVGRARPAAGGPCGARARLDLEGSHLPQVPRRPARVGGRREGDARRRDRGDPDPAQPARRARAADRRDRGRGGDRGRGAAQARPRRLSVLRPLAAAARERARHARRPLPVGRVRRAAATNRLGPHRGRHPRPHRRAQARRHERRHDPRSRALRRPPRRRRRPRRRARRGDGLRGAARTDVHARRLDLADRGDHARPRDRLARARCSWRRAVLEGRGRRTPVRARREDRPRLTGACRPLRRERPRAPPRGVPPRPACGPEPAHLPARAGRRDRRRPLRPRDRGRALPRRDRRLARLHPDPVRRPRARAVGNGADRAAA